MSFLTVIVVLLSAGMHASWNLIAHIQRLNRGLFVRVCLMVGCAGLAPVLLAEVLGRPFPAAVWGLLAMAGLSLGLYFFGLMMGYRSGEFSLVYPLARSLCVLFMAGFDVLRGHIPSAAGWLGLSLVAAGCMLTAIRSLRGFHIRQFLHASIWWALLIAVASVGYSTVDKIAAEWLPQSGWSAARYGLWEYLCAAPFVLILTSAFTAREAEPIRGTTRWFWPGVVAVLDFGSYWLILCAYQLSPLASYVLGLRQFSIVLGVFFGAVVLRESNLSLRFAGAAAVCAGMLCISLWG